MGDSGFTAPKPSVVNKHTFAPLALKPAERLSPNKNEDMRFIKADPRVVNEEISDQVEGRPLHRMPDPAEHLGSKIPNRNGVTGAPGRPDSSKKPKKRNV